MLTTDGHKASRGLSATAELLVWDTDHQVATVAMETTQLVLSQLTNFLNNELRIE